jgi:hypothetical protein
VLEQRNVVVLTTTTGVRLVAIWKQRLDRWYIVAVEESENEKENLKKVIDKLTPRQFQDAVENGRYSII